jgi:uncharacterized DUF497 family protein
MEFRWNDWNIEHIGGHGVTRDEAEWVVEHAARPFPQRREDEKWAVWGPSPGGRLLQVIYVLDDDHSVFVIHTRPLTAKEKRRYKKRTKR